MYGCKCVCTREGCVCVCVSLFVQLFLENAWLYRLLPGFFPHQPRLKVHADLGEPLNCAPTSTAHGTTRHALNSWVTKYFHGICGPGTSQTLWAKTVEGKSRSQRETCPWDQGQQKQNLESMRAPGETCGSQKRCCRTPAPDQPKRKFYGPSPSQKTQSPAWKPSCKHEEKCKKTGKHHVEIEPHMSLAKLEWHRDPGK